MRRDLAEFRTMTDDGSGGDDWLPIVALEGPSGVGKTTLLREISKRLAQADVPVDLASNNDSGRWGPLIRDLANHSDRPLTLALATAAARAELRETARRPLLCDRYVLSTLVYQRFAGVPLDYLYAANRPLLAGSVTIALRLEADKLAERRRDRARKFDWFKDRLDIGREIDLYDEASKLLAKKGHDVRVVDASMDQNTIAERLATELASVWTMLRPS
jgi:dTMP kinase